MTLQIIIIILFLLFVGFLSFFYLRKNRIKSLQRVHSSFGEFKQVRREIQDINAGAVVVPQGSKKTSKYSDKYRKGNILLHEKKYDEAISIFKQLADIPEETELSMISLGTSYSLKGETKIAEKCYARSLELNDKNYNALLGMANINYKSQQYAVAATYYLKAKGIMPELPDVYWGLACTYNLLGEKKLASDNAKIFVRMVPDSRYRPMLEEMIIS